MNTPDWLDLGPMKFTLSLWMCTRCARQGDFDGFGNEALYDSNGEKTFECAICHQQTGIVLRYRIPGQDIRFRFVSSYRMWTSYYPKRGRAAVQAADGSQVRLEYTGNPEPYDPEEHNYTEEEYKEEVVTQQNTIKWSDHNSLIPDDILNAFRIFHADPTVMRWRWDDKTKRGVRY